MIDRLVLKNFRSYTDTTFDFSKKTNIIIGNNGVGKTNIIEAIHTLSTGTSFRVSDKDIIQYDKNQTKISGLIDGKKRDISIYQNKSKEITIQNSKYKRMNFNQTIPIVLFEPNFMQIISRGPDKRREYFDNLLSKIHQNYQPLLNKYKRIITQRNNLLKNSHFSQDEMFIWNIKTSEVGGQLADYRSNLVEEINKELSSIYTNLSDEKSKVNITYSTKNNIPNYSDSLLKSLEKDIHIDKITGFTSSGPHRDDYIFSLNNKDASISASRGENRTILLALKILETKLIEKAREISPILLLDDVFSELDIDRQTKLVDYLYQNQVIITTTTITPLMKGVDGKIIEL